MPEKKPIVMYNGKAKEIQAGDTVFGIKQHFVKSKSATESVTSSATLQDDDDFVITGLKANTKYTISMHIQLTCGASGGFKWAFTLPSGASGRAFFTNTQFTPNDADLTAGSGTTASQSNLNIIMSATLTTAGNAGDLRFRWAQNASNATATQIHRGSHMRVTEE